MQFRPSHGLMPPPDGVGQPGMPLTSWVTLLTNQPTIEAEITFLPPVADGRAPASDLSAGSYQPHLVVQASGVRTAVTDGGSCHESYLGVAFVAGPVRPAAGHPSRVTLRLCYYPDVNYDALRDGATFTVREGTRVVGFGTVHRGLAVAV